MSSRSRENTQPLKVVIIDTKYVETDAVSFKDVVQRLTGKDSPVDDDNNERAPARRFGVDNYQTGNNGGTRGNTSQQSSGFLATDISFKDFERLLREMPPMDEPIWVD